MLGNTSRLAWWSCGCVVVWLCVVCCVLSWVAVLLLFKIERLVDPAYHKIPMGLSLKSFALLNFFNIHRGDPCKSNFRGCLIQFWCFSLCCCSFSQIVFGPGCVLHMDVGFPPSQKNYRLLLENPILEAKQLEK